MLIYCFQILSLAFIVQYLGSSAVLGRSFLAEKIQSKNAMHGRLRDKTIQGNARGLKTAGPHGVAVNETNERHLMRIKRNLSNNSCYQDGTFKTFIISRRTYFEMKCKSSTLWGCFNAISQHTTTKCTETRVFYASIQRYLVQGCKCAS